MSLTVVLDALALPANAKVEQRIPKKLLVEQGAPTAADKRQIQDGIEELQWVAALKPTNIAVPAYRDSEREYLEVAVLTAVFRQSAKVVRLTELIHRAIPYPVVLVSSHRDGHGGSGEGITVSAAHKRFAQNETGKVVVDEIVTTPAFSLEPEPAGAAQAFLDSLALSKLPSRDLFALYQSWLDRLVGLSASAISGRYVVPESPAHTHLVQDAIALHSQLRYEVAALRAQAVKEKQLNRLVDLNAKIKQLELQLRTQEVTLAAH